MKSTKNATVYKFAITPCKITEKFRDYLKSKGYSIICTYYGFCPHFPVNQWEDVTFYKGGVN